MRNIITMAAAGITGTLLTLTIPASALAAPTSAHATGWPSLCAAAKGGLCAQAGKHVMLSDPFNRASFGQAASWSTNSGPSDPQCGPNSAQYGTLHVWGAPYNCPFKIAALDQQFAGKDYSALMIGLQWCAGSRKVNGAWIASNQDCWSDPTMLVQVRTSSGFRYVSIVASDAAGRAMYLTKGARGAPLTWRPTAGSSALWTFRHR